MKDAHACETSDLDLESNVSAEINIDLSLLGGVSTSVGTSSAPDSSETLVSNLINHFVDVTNY